MSDFFLLGATSASEDKDEDEDDDDDLDEDEYEDEDEEPKLALNLATIVFERLLDKNSVIISVSFP